MNLLKLNVWRKIILVSYVLSLIILFCFDWGYHYHIGHAIRLGVGAIALWLVMDKV